jgi:hypothetical protein
VSLKDTEQLKVSIHRGIPDKVREIVAKRHGIHKHGLLSYEVERALLYYIQVDGVLPFDAHTHKKSHKTGAKDIRTINNIGGVSVNMAEAEMIPTSSSSSTTSAIITKTWSGDREEDYKDKPMEEDPKIIQWLLTRGINLRDIGNVISHLTEEDYRVGNLKGEDARQWKKQAHDELVTRMRSLHIENNRAKLEKRENELLPELRSIKHLLSASDSIVEQDKVYREQLYKEWIVATGNKHQTVFSNRVHEYIHFGYLTPLDAKHKKFRAEGKFLNL